MPDFSLEIAAGTGPVCGVDEAGRGPLAGPVVAAAVIFPPDGPPAHLASRIDDSKKLKPAAREALVDEIQQAALAYAVAEADVAEIDSLNILHATMAAMTRAIEALDPTPRVALIDGNRAPPLLFCEAQPVVQGDAKSLSIAAASILAKTARDAQMAALHEVHPQYGWLANQGYPTKAHLAAIAEHGITPHHRRSFRPVAEALLALS